MLRSATSTSNTCFYIPTENNMGQGKAGSFLYCILPLIIQTMVIQTCVCACHWLQMASSPTPNVSVMSSDSKFANTKCQ